MSELGGMSGPTIRAVPAGALVGLTLLLAGCASRGPTETPLPTSTATPLPSGYVRIARLSGVPPAPTPVECLGVGFGDAVLRGDPNAPEKVWIEVVDAPGSTPRRSVTWPAGFVARFTPRLELLDADGRVVARDGDLLTGLGGSPIDDLHWIIDEINGRSYPCY